ncbi:hypothetical protein [Pontibacter beigongshangensis]|uniref:hypothetical protein n=1 Tax=Pontibacter beigongshangensis TaxID=2574733 RepID=UPI00164EE24B|nr:hypothetical protein [Pontibacter beigongshangensis]
MKKALRSLSRCSCCSFARLFQDQAPHEARHPKLAPLEQQHALKNRLFKLM